MKITKTSPFSGRPHTLDIPNLTPELLERINNRGRATIQSVPGALTLTADEREFLMTGITASEWDSALSDK